MLSVISICRGCLMVTHLFFADNSLLFCKTIDQECHNLIEILELYEAAFGQKVNAEINGEDASNCVRTWFRSSAFSALDLVR